MKLTKNECTILVNNGTMYESSLNVGNEWSGILDFHPHP
jgi:hypothetical protein